MRDSFRKFFCKDILFLFRDFINFVKVLEVVMCIKFKIVGFE